MNFPLCRGGWCATEKDNLQWLEVSFDTPIKAMAIQTKGVQANPPTLIKDAWVKSYEIGYSIDGSEWNLYQDKNGKDMVIKQENYYSKVSSISYLQNPFHQNYFNIFTYRCFRETKIAQML